VPPPPADTTGTMDRESNMSHANTVNTLITLGGLLNFLDAICSSGISF